MSTQKARWVMLDTTSAALKLDGNWTAGNPLFGASPNSGLPTSLSLDRSYHGSIQTVFKGSEMIVYGSSDDWGRPFNCTVDGIEANVALYAWGFVCSWKGDETSNPHRLLLNTTRALEAQFRVESVWYLPSPEALPTLGHGEWAVYPHDDPEIQYSGTWGNLTHEGESASIATQSQTGSSALLRFRGTRVIWDGRSPGSLLGSTDSGEQIQILRSLDQISTLNLTTIEISIFPRLGGEYSNFMITRLGTSPRPLAVYHILVEGGDLQLTDAPGDAKDSDDSRPVESSSLAGSPSSTPTPQTHTPRKISIGAMVGGAVGGVLVIIGIAMGLLWSRKRRKTRRANADFSQPIATFFGPISSPAIYRKGLEPLASSQGGSVSAVSSFVVNHPVPLSIEGKNQVPNRTPTSGTDHDMSTATAPRQHQDSGVRLRRDSEGSIPPMYTIE